MLIRWSFNPANLRRSFPPSCNLVLRHVSPAACLRYHGTLLLTPAFAIQPNQSSTMPGLDQSTPQPTEIILHQTSCLLEVGFDDGARFELPTEFLRVHSPSAEVRGHGKGQETLQTGKRDVKIIAIEPAGSYGIKPSFSDGHNSGIFSWDVLYYLGKNQEALWAGYLRRLAAAGASRDAVASAKTAANPSTPCKSQT